MIDTIELIEMKIIKEKILYVYKMFRNIRII